MGIEGDFVFSIPLRTSSPVPDTREIFSDQWLGRRPDRDVAGGDPGVVRARLKGHLHSASDERGAIFSLPANL